MKKQWEMEIDNAHNSGNDNIIINGKRITKEAWEDDIKFKEGNNELF